MANYFFSFFMPNNKHTAQGPINIVVFTNSDTYQHGAACSSESHNATDNGSIPNTSSQHELEVIYFDAKGRAELVLCLLLEASLLRTRVWHIRTRVSYAEFGTLVASGARQNCLCAEHGDAAVCGGACTPASAASGYPFLGGDLVNHTLVRCGLAPLTTTKSATPRKLWIQASFITPSTWSPC